MEREREVDGGDQAIRELRGSWDEGSGMLRIISKVVRLRIWRRAPERQAMWVPVGEGMEGDVAASVSKIVSMGNENFTYH